MRKVTRLVITALFLQFFIGGVSAEAAPAIRINAVSVGGTNVTVKWTSTKLTSKDYFQVEFTKAGSKPKIVKTKSTAIIAKLDAFSKYTVRVRKNLSPKIWSPTRTFSVTAAPVSGILISNSTYSAAEITWPAVVGATAYEVSLNKDLPITTVLNKYTFTGLKTGYVGSFTVRAISGAIKGESSQPIQFSTLSTGPAKLAASAITSTGFTLTWEAIAGATSYNVYKDKTLFGTTTLATLAVSGQLPGTTADFTVKAVVGGSETNASEALPVTTLVDVPKKPVVSGITSISATITWSIDPNADSYEIKVYDALGTTIVRDLDAQKSVASTVITGLSPLTTYTVGVINIYGKTSSKISELTSFATLKPSVLGLNAAAVTINSATIAWTALPSVTNFEVLQDSRVIAISIPISTLSYTFTGLAPGQTYEFGVRATYTDGNKILSSTDISKISVTLLTDVSGKPTNVTAPVITLPFATVPIIGARLTTTNGVWTSIPAATSLTLQWQRSSGVENWADIASATGTSYEVTSNDNGFAFRVKSTATNVNGTTISYSSATGYSAPLYNVVLPVTRGNLVVGQILEASDGVWSSSYTTNLSYRWQRVCSGTTTTITDALTPTYTITEADIGCSVLVQVTGSTLLGSAIAISPSRGLVTIVGNTVTPVISGSLRVGGTLSVTSGTWVGSPTLAYRWQSSTDGNIWDTISGATSPTYVLTVAQAGLYVRAQVLGSKSSTVPTAYTIVATTTNTAVVPTLSITNSVAPAVTGSWTEGTTLSASTGTWSTSGTYTYQWQSSSDNSTWSDIASATSSSYTLTSSEGSKYVRVQVINTSSAGSGVAYSVARSKVGSPFNTTLPAITGTIKVGSTQTVSTGTWSNTPTAYSYQWQKSADGISWTNLSGETASTYVPTFDVANLRIRVSVGAGNTVDTATVTTAIVSGFLPPQATAIPTISGTTTALQTLTSTSGTWPGTSDSYVYQWQRSSDSGVTWTNISGATASTYVLVAADAGYQIRSQVSLTTNTGSSSAYSLPTVGIAP
jgi:hypothetical protein